MRARVPIARQAARPGPPRVRGSVRQSSTTAGRPARSRAASTGPRTSSAIAPPARLAAPPSVQSGAPHRIPSFASTSP